MPFQRSIDPVKPVSLADAMQQWGAISGQQQERRLMDMKMQEAEQNAPLQRQLLQAHAQDYQAQADERGQKAHLQKLTMAQHIAATIKQKMDASGLQPGTPEFQQQLDAIGNPYRPIMASAFGKPETEQPMDWNGINTLAGMQLPTNADGKNHIQFLSTPQGIHTGDTITGEVRPVVGTDGKPLFKAPDDPELQGKITAAKEENKIEKQVKGNGEIIPMRNKDALNTVEMDKAEQAALIRAANQDSDPQLKAAAIAKLNSLENRIGQSTEAEAKTKADVENNKQMDLSAKKREQSAQNMTNLLDSKIDGESIDDLINKATGSGAGAVRDKALGIVGASTEAGQAAAKLKTVHDWLTANVPRMEGPQSNFDVQRYEAMAGQIGDPHVPAEVKKAALAGLKEIIKKYSGGEQQGSKSAEPKQATGKVKFLGFD